ncbi:MAG: vanadium-dependent haloperoxidase, partial [Chloroflexota bacterium]|nr:vanadium-dependent haloperoxidase [Chloroflexota bacterium]
MRLGSALVRAEARVIKSRPSRIAATVVSLVLALSGVSAAAHAQSAGNAVTEWNLIAMNTLVPFPPPAGGAPPAIQVHMGMVQGAVYDAVNATEPRRRQPYLLDERFAPTASKEAAVATAAYRVLSNIVSTVPARIAFPNRADLLQALDTAYDTSLAAIPDGPAKIEGIAAGDAAADAMITAREEDGRFGPSPWKSNQDPGHWQPLLNPDGTQMLDPTPWGGGVRPFLIESASQFRTDGPRVLSAETWATDFNEVKALGSVNSTARTPEQTHVAIWWQSAGGPTRLWNTVARDLVNDPTYGIDIVESARLYAMMNLAAADAAITCWSEKYYW